MISSYIFKYYRYLLKNVALVAFVFNCFLSRYFFFYRGEYLSPHLPLVAEGRIRTYEAFRHRVMSPVTLSSCIPRVKLERIARIELASSAWKAEVLPLNYIRITSLTENIVYHLFSIKSTLYFIFY